MSTGNFDNDAIDDEYSPIVASGREPQACRIESTGHFPPETLKSSASSSWPPSAANRLQLQRVSNEGRGETVAETCNPAGAKQDAESLREVCGSLLSIPGLLTGVHQYRNTCGVGLDWVKTQDVPAAGRREYAVQWHLRGPQRRSGGHFSISDMRV